MNITVYRNYKPGTVQILNTNIITVKIELSLELFFSKKEPDINDEDFAKCLKIWGNFLKIMSTMTILKYI